MRTAFAARGSCGGGSYLGFVMLLHALEIRRLLWVCEVVNGALERKGSQRDATHLLTDRTGVFGLEATEQRASQDNTETGQE